MRNYRTRTTTKSPPINESVVNPEATKAYLASFKDVGKTLRQEVMEHVQKMSDDMQNERPADEAPLALTPEFEAKLDAISAIENPVTNPDIVSEPPSA